MKYVAQFLSSKTFLDRKKESVNCVHEFPEYIFILLYSEIFIPLIQDGAGKLIRRVPFLQYSILVWVWVGAEELFTNNLGNSLKHNIPTLPVK